MKKVIGLVVVLLIASALGLKYFKTNNPEPEPQKSVAVSTEAAPISTSSVAVSTESPRSVQIDIERPVDGVRKGVIEVGASGFNAFVVT